MWTLLRTEPDFSPLDFAQHRSVPRPGPVVTDMTRHDPALPEVVPHEEWLAARKELLVKEKELTQARDRLNAERRRLPMVRVEKDYVFEGPDGPAGLLDLFEGRRQLVLHHFMWNYEFDADGREIPRDIGCPSCSATADNIANRTHLHVRDTTLAAVSRAPQAKIGPFRARMGWTFPWYSSFGSDFNYDFHATVDDRVAPVLLNFRTEDELAAAGSPGDYPGLSAFLRMGTRSSTPTPRSPAVSSNPAAPRLPRPDRARPAGGVGAAARARDRPGCRRRQRRPPVPRRVRRARHRALTAGAGEDPVQVPGRGELGVLELVELAEHRTELGPAQRRDVGGAGPREQHHRHRGVGLDAVRDVVAGETGHRLRAQRA